MMVILRILSNECEFSISLNPADTRLPGYVARIRGTAPPMRVPHRPGEVNPQRAENAAGRVAVAPDPEAG